SVRRALERLAHTAGFSSQGFASGGEVLRAVRAGPRGCVGLDLRLSRMHGLALPRQLARTHPQLRVVGITGDGGRLTRRVALAAGAIAFLSKPFDDAVLLEAMNEAVRRIPNGPQP